MILRPKEIIIAIHLFLCIFWNLFIPFPFQQSFLLQCQLSHCPASTSFVLLGYGNSLIKFENSNLNIRGYLNVKYWQ